VPTSTRTATVTATEDEARVSRSRSRGGRPSRTEALQLGNRILEVATELFLSNGYGSTTIEAVAARAGISKRTFYHRFDDKASLFAAVVRHIIARIRPPPDVPLLEGATLDDVLRRLARLVLRAALSAEALALNRLLVAESLRFPELVSAAHGAGGEQEGVALIGGLLARELTDPPLPPDAAAFAARQFLQMVVTVPQRRAMGFGTPMSPEELEAWADRVVALFLDGCRGGLAVAARG
jgi:AcrR family transcriptional regulator